MTRQPLRLEIKRKLAQRSERVKAVDLHHTEPWIMACLYSGSICIWNYQTQTMVKSFEVSELPVRSGKFIARKQWVVAGADDMFIRVYNYNTMDKVKVFEAHTDYIRCVAVHPTLPYVLSASDDMLIKLWDWDKGWMCTQIFEGHSHYVMQVTFNPKDTNTFASASLDRTVKIWSLGSPDPNFTLDGHSKGVNCVDYFTGGNRPYLITGSDDQTAKVWDYQTKSCVQTLEGHAHNVSAVCFHPELPIIMTGSEDGTVRLWHSTTYRLENTLNYGLERVWALGYMKGSRRVVIGYDEGTIMIKIGREEPVASMDNSGKIIWAKHNEIQTVNIKAVGADTEITDGERLPLAVKELGSCDLYPQSLRHNPNGRFVVVCGDGEYIIYTALAWRNRSFGSALEIVWSTDGEYAVRESTSKIKIYSKNFQNLYWADSGDLVTIASDSSFYILKCYVLTIPFHALQVTTMFHLDRPMYLLGYLANQSRVYLIDKEFNVVGYTLLLSLIEYKTLVMRGDLEHANAVLPSVPKEQHNSVAHFLESRGMLEEALEIATDPNYRFDLTVQLGNLEIAKEIAVEAQSESKWKQLGELAMSTGKVYFPQYAYFNSCDCLVLYVNSKAAESLADPADYPNLFEDWQIALNVETTLAPKRGSYPLAEEYITYAERSNESLVEAFKSMQVIEDDGVEESPEDVVEVEADDSTDGGVLVNGNDGEEHWGMNNAGTSSS
ncbi:hypothetical protein PR202_ga15051 [Eleusine coracana subsp. coracana]|uniref:Uncharacterized protein n=1 Tax=Eleusine coracana subsp. coracana TaxID=191504 RepID=A0AAV5CJD1_ELECO|nr:hypothetical protein PR202_ga15051 [Eleusine coracana subsp. coracana]